MDSAKRALVVDDDDPIRLMLSKLIEPDFDVDTARDGAEAIERLDTQPYDVILLDLMMPRVDGYAVLEHMEERHPDLLQHTIIASAVPRSEVLARMPRLACRVHTKPFDVARLLDDVESCAG